MVTGWMGYDPSRVEGLRLRARRVLEELAAIRSDDPAAAAAMATVRSVRADLDGEVMGLLDRVASSDAMLTWSGAGGGGGRPLGWRHVPEQRLSNDELVSALEAAVDAVLDGGATDQEWDRLAVVLADLAGRAGQPSFVGWLVDEHGTGVFDRLVLALDRANQRAGVEAPPATVLQAAATLLVKVAAGDGRIRGRIGELRDDFVVMGRLQELAPFDARRDVQLSTIDDLIDAADAAGIAADFVEEAMAKFDRSELEVIIVTSRYEELWLISDGSTTGTLSVSGTGTFTWVDEVPTDLTRLAGEIGKVAGLAGDAIDAVSTFSAFTDGWEAAEGEPITVKLLEGVGAALPVATDAVVDGATFAAGTGVCAAIPFLGVISPLCGVAAVVGKDAAVDALDNEGAEPSFCEGGVFDAEEADSMGFDHTTEEVHGCD